MYEHLFFNLKVLFKKYVEYAAKHLIEARVYLSSFNSSNKIIVLCVNCEVL